MAPFMAIEPSFVAESVDNTPPKLPIGVLFAETIQTFFMSIQCLCKIKFIVCDIKKINSDLFIETVDI